MTLTGINQSKVTSLVLRKTSDIDDEEMMQYTESNVGGADGTHYFQLESGTGSD